MNPGNSISVAMTARIISCLLCATAIAGVYAQTDVIRRFTVNDGLPATNVVAALTDREGYLWIGGYNGISRFDGSRFTNYGLQHGIPSLHSGGLYVDSRHQLWIGTIDGIGQMRGDSLLLHKVQDTKQPGYFFTFSEGADGKTVALTDQGIYGWNGKQWLKQTWMPGTTHFAARAFVHTDNGTYINHGHFLGFQQPGKPWIRFWDCRDYTDPPDFNLLHVHKGNAYVNTAHHLYAIRDTMLVPVAEEYLAGKRLRFYLFDSRDRLWMYTDQDGLVYFNPGITNGLPHKVNHVFRFTPSSICEDRENNIWICSPDGLFRISTEQLLFRPEQDQGPGTELRNIYTLPGGMLLLSRSGKGFSLFNSNAAGKEQFIGGANQDRDFADRFATGTGNTVWIATRRNRLYRLDGIVLNDLTHLMPPDNRYFTMGLAFDRRTGMLFLCTDSTLLSLQDNSMSVVIPRNTGRPIFHPNSIHISRFGERLFYTVGPKMLELTETNTWQEAKLDITFPTNLMHCKMAEDAAGRLWIATAGIGLFLAKRMPGGQWKKMGQITKQEGLSDNYLHSMTVDSSGQCWLVTSAGIDVVRASPEGNLSVARHLNAANGIPCSDWSFGKLTTDHSGRVWFAYPDGLVQFDPAMLRSAPTTPAIVIASVLVNNQAIDWSTRSDSLATYRLLGVHPRLRPQENNLQITYHGIRFRDPVVLEYSYRLNPTDSPWNNISQGNTVTLLNLLPGEYRFEVRARERGGSWSNPAVFSFSIAAPWYMTAGFRLLALLATAMLLISLYRLRIRQVRKKESLLRTMKELEMTALKAQMNPHFIFNAMNSIQALVADRRPDEAMHYIGTFSRLLRQVMEQSDEQTIPLSRELDTVGLYVELESLRLNHELHYSCHYPEELVPEYERVPPLILQPLVENAIWHGLSNKQGRKEIRLDIRTENDWLVFTIEDNGVGRELSQVRRYTIGHEHTGRGLTITRQRLEAFNPETETRMLEITDLRREDGTPMGTRVLVRVSRHASGGQGTGKGI